MTDLEYLTIDSIQWATGHVRPRMGLEEKRAKHRIHQRDFMLRQRKRMEQLERDLSRYTLELKLMEATREAAALVAENEALQRQLSAFGTPPTAGTDNLPFKVCCEDSASDVVLEECEEVAILEMLNMLPDVRVMQVDSPSDVGAFVWCHDTLSGPLAWPTSPSCASRFQTLLG